MAPKGANRAYFPFVEGVRGISALYVFLYHMAQRALLVMSPLGWLLPWKGFFSAGHYGVSVFIVVSGYCLGFPVARSLAKPFDVKEFAKRRFRRLYPAYVAALALALPVFYVDALLLIHRVPPLSHVVAGVVSHLTMTHNFSKRTVTYISGPLWSIALEVQIYVVFALVLVPIWKKFGSLAQFVAALTLSLIPHFVFHGLLDYACPWMLALFAIGVCGADETVRGPRASVPWTWVALGACAVALALVATHTDYDMLTASANWILPDLVVGAATSIMFVACAANGRWLPAKVFGSKPLQFLGTFSYSLYLIHATVIGFVWALLEKTHASTLTWLVTWALTIPATVFVAYGLFIFAERPFLSKAFRANLDAAHLVPKLSEPEVAVT